MMDQPPYVQEEPFVNPINDEIEFYDTMIGFSGASVEYPYPKYSFQLNPRNLDTNIDYVIKKAIQYFQAEDRTIIIGFINQAKIYLLKGENIKAAHSFTAVCEHMHEIRER